MGDQSVEVNIKVVIIVVCSVQCYRPDLDSVNPTAVRQVIRRLVDGEWKDVAASELPMLGGAVPPYQLGRLPTIEEQSAPSRGGSNSPSDESSDGEAVVEETVTTR